MPCTQPKEDAIVITLHISLTPVERERFARLLFLDFSKVFTITIPEQTGEQAAGPGLSQNICCWVLDFLLSTSSGSPQGCVLSPLLYTFSNYDCTPTQHCQACK